jgi:hypothetical protein
MLIADERYFALLTTLTDMHKGCDTYVVIGRAWVENQVQVALCTADIYPASSADCDPHDPSIVLHGEEPSAELVAEVEQMLAGLGSASVH